MLAGMHTRTHVHEHMKAEQTTAHPLGHQDCHIPASFSETLHLLI